MSRYDWLLFLHVTGAFLLIGGIVVAVVFSLAAMRRERPSEIALLMRLTRIAVVAVGAGMLMTLGFGLWLVHHVGYGWSDGWIVAALVLWAVSGALGGRAGERDRKTSELAVRLAAAGDEPTPELRARLRDPLTLALNWGSAIGTLAILVLMVWKPGA